MEFSCPGPIEEIGKPDIEVPALACDAHFHVLGPLDRYPYVDNRSFTPPPALTDAYLRTAETLGLQRAVVVQPSVYGADNRRTVAAVAEIGPERARGVAMVAHDVTEAELQRLDEAGIRATRFITTAGGGPTLDQLPEVAAKIAPLGWHIEMYIPAKVWPDILPVVSRLPVPVVFDHMGGFPSETDRSDASLDAILGLVSSGRCWVKLCGYRNSTAGYPYDDVTPLARRFIDATPDRCVWGTDWPHFMMNEVMPGDDMLLNLLGDWEPDPGVRHKILVTNPAALYRF